MKCDGELYICTLTETQATGRKPAAQLVPESESRTYERRRFGYGRIYAAKGADEQIDALYRIWDDLEDTVHANLYVLTDNNVQYRIDAVQNTDDEHGKPVLDLTLKRLEANYDVAQ